MTVPLSYETHFFSKCSEIVFKIVMKIPKTSVVSEILSVEVETPNNPYLEEKFRFP